MNEIVQFLARHGYWLLFGAVLGRQACLPIPANLVLLAAGALARSGRLSLSGAIGLSVMTLLLADLAWFEAGRRFGNRALHFVCGVSRHPESCVLEATGSFASYGVRTLFVSKFVVGLDAVAVPLAGAAGTPVADFLVCDVLGALFWSATWSALGYVFSDQLDGVATHVVRTGRFVALAALVGFVSYVVYKLLRSRHFMHQFALARITPDQLRDKLKGGEDVLILDLRSCVDSSDESVAIPGAVCVNPRRLERYKDAKIGPSREVVLYCDCPGEFTSARVALALRRRGVERVRPLAGGLQAWRDRGFPVVSKPRVPSHPVLHT